MADDAGDLAEADRSSSGQSGTAEASSASRAASGRGLSLSPRGSTPGARAVRAPRAVVRYFELDWRTVLAALAVVMAFGAVYAAVRFLPTFFTLFVVAGFLSLAMNPLVRWITSRLHLPRGVSIGAVLLLLIGSVALVVVFFGDQTVQQAEQIQDELPTVLDEMTTLPVIGPTLAENDVPQKVQEWLSDLPAKLGSDQNEVVNFVSSLTQGVGYALLAGILIVGFLIDGPALARRARQLIPTENLDRASRLGHIVYEVIAKYFAGTLLLGLLQGVMVLISGLILNVPLTPLLAVWAGLTAMLPQIGGALGGIVVVAVSLTQGLPTALIMGALFVAYMTFSNNVLLPVVVGRAINVSPPTTMLAAIGGFAVGGIVGALFAMPVVGAIKAVVLDARGLRTAEEEGEDERGPPEPEKPPRRGLASWILHKLRSLGHRGSTEDRPDEGDDAAAAEGAPPAPDMPSPPAEEDPVSLDGVV